MKLFTTSHVFDHDWKTVTLAAQNKYPNPFSSHVVAVDVINRHIDDHGVLVTERLITYKGYLPSWLKSITGSKLGSANTYIQEFSRVNVSTGAMELRSENVTGREYMSVSERCTYERKHGVTEFTQTAEMNAGYGWTTVKLMLESKMVERFDRSAGQGREGMQYVIDNLEEILQEAKFKVAQNVDGVVEGLDGAIGEVKDLIKSATDP